MKSIALFAVLASVACSGTNTNSKTPGRDGTLTAKAPDVVSAPSLRFMAGGDAEAKPEPQSAAPDGPRVVNFTDVKFRLTLPGKDWDVNITEHGVLLVNLKTRGMIMLVVAEDARALKDIAEEERKGVSQSGSFKATPVTEEKNPDRARFSVDAVMPDGTKVTMVGVYRRNPGNPSQTIAFIGTWVTGQKATKKEVLGIIDSVMPLQ